MDGITLKSFVPEIFLSLTILLNLILNIILINNLRFNYPLINREIFIQCFFILICLFFLVLNNKIEGYLFNFLFVNNLSIKIVKLLLILISIFLLFPVTRAYIMERLNFFEYFILFLFSVLSTLLLVSVSDMLSAYLVIELQALCFYILSSFKRNSAYSSEAGLKYFISGSFISGIFLLGCSIIFGLVGTLNFNNLGILFFYPFSINLEAFRSFLIIGIILVTVVFLFKISAAPFHFWSPDVYEGSPLSSTIIFSILPKIAIFYLFIKWLLIIKVFEEVKILLIISGLLSIFIGSLFALRQKRLKRLILYSSIAQVGFLVTGLSTLSLNGFIGIYFFLIIYIITSLLIWNNVSLFYSFQNKINVFNESVNSPLFLSNISSFFKVNKIWSFSNILIFFSLAGIPPLVGFFSKVLILFYLVKSNFLLSSFFLLITSALSAFYYLRIIKIIFFENKIRFQINFSQIIFKDFLFEYDCLIISFLLFLLVFLFFFPSYLLILCYLIQF